MAPSLEWWELALRLLGAAAFGGLIGFEREYSDQPAGFRTHILVTLGAALFTIAGAYGAVAFAGGDAVRFDPTRVAAQVVTGIGFLGAGAILRQGINIRGLTTAASIWVSASIGVAVALGYWTAAAFTTGIALGSLLLLRPVGRVVVRSLRKSVIKVVVDIEPRARLGKVNDELDRLQANVQTMRVVGEADGERQIVMSLELPSHLEPAELVDALREIDGVNEVDSSR
ncbi:MAG: MgtC/SapB family protein [Actinomycetota bacterium]|nr:MgtC/SapB family protein [Actinomycetota bacterium]